jgi:hypothetical protein
MQVKGDEDITRPRPAVIAPTDRERTQTPHQGAFVLFDRLSSTSSGDKICDHDGDGI